MAWNHFRVQKLTFGAVELLCKSKETFKKANFSIKRAFHCSYNLCTGKYPFDGDNIYRLLESIGRGQWEAPDWLYKLDEKLAVLILGMLQDNPEERYSIQQIRQDP